MERLALLIDGENISADCFPLIARLCSQLGTAATHSAQVFADFRQGAAAGWLDVCASFGLKPEFQLAIRGKNSVDIAITIAAMDILATGVADTICLVSSDRDFIPLAHRVRAAGVSMVGIGRAPADSTLMKACDRFLLLASVNEIAKPIVAASPGVSEDERRFLIDTIEELYQDNKSTPFHPGLLGNELKRRDGKLFERVGGKKLLKRLVALNVAAVHGTDGDKRVSPTRR